MIDLNLLSPDRREALNARILYANIERTMIVLVIVTFLTALLLVAIKTRMLHRLNDIESRQLLSTEYVAVNKEIKQLNASINSIEKLQKRAAPASILIEDIVRRTPPGILISELDFETQTRSMRINGFASTRDSLLSYESNLLDSPFIEKLDSPISNLFLKTDLDFRFQAVLNIDRLRQELEPKNDEH